jgi:hypothetical protein
MGALAETTGATEVKRAQSRGTTGRILAMIVDAWSHRNRPEPRCLRASGAANRLKRHF